MTKFRLPVLVEHSVGQVESRRQELSQEFETAIRLEAKQAGVTVTCTPGCASCCYHPISISLLEAIPIYRHLLKNGKWTLELRDRLKDTGDRQLSTAYEVWLLSLIPCPLLSEDKLCTAYESRPLVCRTMLSVGDPYYCHPHRLGDQTEIIPQEGTVTQFSQEESRALRKHKIQVAKMPLGLALLYAEKVCTGDMTLSAVDADLMKEFAANG